MDEIYYMEARLRCACAFDIEKMSSPRPGAGGPLSNAGATMPATMTSYVITILALTVRKGRLGCCCGYSRIRGSDCVCNNPDGDALDTFAIRKQDEINDMRPYSAYRNLQGRSESGSRVENDGADANLYSPVPVPARCYAFQTVI